MVRHNLGVIGAGCRMNSDDGGCWSGLGDSFGFCNSFNQPLQKLTKNDSNVTPSTQLSVNVVN